MSLALFPLILGSLVLGALVAALVLAVRGHWIGATILGAVVLLVVMGGLGALFVGYSVETRHHVERAHENRWKAMSGGPDMVHFGQPPQGVRVLRRESFDADGRLESRRLLMHPNGDVTEDHGEPTVVESGDPWRDAARRHEEWVRERHLTRNGHDSHDGHGRRGVRVDMPDAEVLDQSELPDWVTDPAANRLVVSGARVTDEDGGAGAARRAAEEAVAARLAEAADLPPGADLTPGDVRPGTVRRAVIETRTLSTGENEFTVYRGHLLVDASPDALEHLRRGYRDRLGRDRSLWAVGGAGLCVALFAGLWGVGRRKLRTA